MNWKEAYFSQAWSDYGVFKTLNKGNIALCHKLHYLQMASEKLAKGFLCESNRPPKKTHFAFVKFLRVSRHRPEYRRKLGYGDNRQLYYSVIDSLLPVADRIEQLAPVGGDFDKANPEYPWRDKNGVVNCPCLYAFSDFKKRELLRLQTLISSLFSIVGFH
jgi:hypothetical protein